MYAWVRYALFWDVTQRIVADKYAAYYPIRAQISSTSLLKPEITHCMSAFGQRISIEGTT